MYNTISQQEATPGISGSNQGDFSFPVSDSGDF